jgi:hypothetical protein
MSFTVMTRRSLSWFEALGGWRTVAEAVASKTVFLVGYLLTDQVVPSALIAVGAVAVFAVVRVCTDRKYWSALIGLVIVGLSTLWAGNTGYAVDFYFVDVVTAVGLSAVSLVSMLVRWPMVGLVVGAARDERLSWRRDRDRRRRYQMCTAVFLLKGIIETAVLLPLYLAEQVIALSIASTLMGAPAAGVCIYLCWRILRTEADPVDPDPALAAPSGG